MATTPGLRRGARRQTERREGRRVADVVTPPSGSSGRDRQAGASTMRDIEAVWCWRTVDAGRRSVLSPGALERACKHQVRTGPREHQV